MYERLQTTLKAKGELMIRMASGAEHELHLHNTHFDDDPFVKVDGQDETHWFNADKVERYWVHQDF